MVLGNDVATPVFIEAFFSIPKRHAKKTTMLTFINADWRDFQSKPASEQFRKGSIMIDDYLRIMNKTGWRHSRIIQGSMSSLRFSAGIVSAMQKKRIIGLINRYVIILSQQERA